MAIPKQIFTLLVTGPSRQGLLIDFSVENQYQFSQTLCKEGSLEKAEPLVHGKQVPSNVKLDNPHERVNIAASNKSERNPQKQNSLSFPRSFDSLKQPNAPEQAYPCHLQPLAVDELTNVEKAAFVKDRPSTRNTEDHSRLLEPNERIKRSAFFIAYPRTTSKEKKEKAKAVMREPMPIAVFKEKQQSAFSSYSTEQEANRVPRRMY